MIRQRGRFTLLLCMTLMVGACGQSDAKQLLQGKWQENVNVPKYQPRGNLPPGPRERTVQFFPDGSGVVTAVYETSTLTQGFSWVLSADGKTLKTETPIQNVLNTQVGGPLVAHIVTLTKKELRIDEPSSANGQYTRVE